MLGGNQGGLRGEDNSQDWFFSPGTSVFDSFSSGQRGRAPSGTPHGKSTCTEVPATPLAVTHHPGVPAGFTLNYDQCFLILSMMDRVKLQHKE